MHQDTITYKTTTKMFGGQYDRQVWGFCRTCRKSAPFGPTNFKNSGILGKNFENRYHNHMNVYSGQLWLKLIGPVVSVVSVSSNTYMLNKHPILIIIPLCYFHTTEILNFHIFLTLCVDMCFLTLDFCAKARPHTIHWKGFSPVWALMCCCRSKFLANALSQYWHRNFFFSSDSAGFPRLARRLEGSSPAATLLTKLAWADFLPISK